MPDLQYFSKLRAFLCDRRQTQSTRSRRTMRRADSTRSTAMLALEPLEARVLLSADLAGAVQATELVPTEPQPAAVFLLDEQTEGNGSVVHDSNYGNLPLSFERNMGQTESQVHYSARGDGYSLFLTDDSAVLSLRQDEESAPAVLTMEVVGTNPDRIIFGELLLPGVTNYFIGDDPSQWRTDIPTFEQVQYDNIYPGIDLLYYGNQGQLEYDFVVAPGTDPAAIELRFTGADQISLNEQGDMLLQIGDEQLTVQKPSLYQIMDGVRQAVSGSFVLNETGTVGFQVGAYDLSQPLIIDPVLIYSTYFGGTFVDRTTALAVDSAGNAYLSGVSSSNNLPGAPARSTGDHDMFVTKLNATGTAVLYTTYLGGTNDESFDGNFVGSLVSVDEAGNAYVGGTTISSDFPITAGAFDRTYNDVAATGIWSDGVVAKLNVGGALVYSTYLGGNRFDQVNGIDVDSAGQIYVTGGTVSVSTTIEPTNYPTTPGAFQRTTVPGLTGSGDAFVSKLNPAGNSLNDLVYSTLLSGSLADFGRGIAVDQQGHAYVTGATSFHVDSFGRFEGGIPTGMTTEQGFVPLSGTFQDGPGGANGDVFVAKLNPAGTGLVYSRYLGGSTSDVGNAIAINDSGHAYVTGWTISGNFPVTAGAFQITPGPGFSRGFVTKLDPTGAHRVYSTYVQGINDGQLSAITVDTEGKAAVTGGTRSNAFVTTSDALQPVHSAEGIPAEDAVVLVLNPAGSGLTYASYLGGNSADIGTGIAWDAAGTLYVGGYTSSTNFPTTSGAFQPSPSLHGDAFVTKIGFNQAPVANPDAYSVNEDTTLTVPARGVLSNDTDADGNALTAALVTGPSNGMLTLNPNGSFTYTPNGNFNGPDGYTYKANDGNANSNVATVSITVAPVNDPPTALNDMQTVNEDSGATAISVLSNDSFAPDTGETLTITEVTQGSNGSVVISGNGTGLTYAPNSNFFGSDTFTYTISDGNGETAMATVGMTISPVNDAPIANAGVDQTVEATSPTGAQVTLNSAGSSDPDGDALTYNWAGSFGTATSPSPTVTLPLGKHSIILTVQDGKGESASDEVVITVQDTTPPILTGLRASPNRLSPPNHQMVSVTISALTSDSADPTVPYRIVAVSSNEPIDGLGDGDTAPDWVITGERTVDLRAERGGSGNGRIYTVTLEAVDDSGNRTTNTVTVTVPRR